MGRVRRVDTAFDAAWFRQVLGNFPTGVAVVTGCGRNRVPVGMAIGSFTSASLDPPLVAFFADRRSSSWPRIRATGAFCANVLGADQEAVCRAFAARGGDKFAGIGWRPAPSGSPILDDVVAWVDCGIETVHETGDHWLVLGRVRALETARPALSLVFFQGGYGRFSPSSLAACESGLPAQPVHLHTADLARPEMDSLAGDLHAECVAGTRDSAARLLRACAAVNPALGHHPPGRA